MSGERITLVSFTSNNSNISSVGPKLQLHLSNHRLTDHKICWEVNCLNEQTEWQVCFEIFEITYKNIYF